MTDGEDMVLERTSEIHHLNTYYNRKGSQILIVYGEKNVGTNSLLWQFVREKPGYYYRARSASDREQRYQWGRELETEKEEGKRYPSYKDIFDTLLRKSLKDHPAKMVCVIDEFQYIVKSGDSFMKELTEFICSEMTDREILVVLASSSIGWVENSMISRIGEAASALSGFLKIRAFGFEDLMEFYPGFSMKQCVEAYAILGGIPGLWKHFDDKYSIKENICRFILCKNTFLYGEGARIVEEELRETGVYNTILAALAAGCRKLNDLYHHTGFSRAKISVYLKNLMELELVEKVFSFDTDGKANAQKGIYRISNHFVHFYFTYLYPNLSCLEKMSAEDFYHKCIEPSFGGYVADYFKLVCRQYIEKMNRRGKLPVKIERMGEWVGKLGNIDLVAQDKAGKTILGLCNWNRPLMGYENYEQFLLCAEKAKLRTDYIYLFSVHRFDEKLKLEAKIKPNLRLISVDGM